MVELVEDSGFFKQPAHQSVKSDGSMRLLHDSAGGWSQLYMANRMGRFRVLKALKPEYRGQALYEELLHKEFEIGYTLSHPGICEVYGFHSIDGIGNCIEMEWVDGDTLASLMSRGRISGKLALRLAGQICSSMSYMHSRQIVHRDLKPSNIMVTHNGQNVKIIDFGLSDSDSSSILKAPAGTLTFAAPELVAGQACDHRADIYSMGRILKMLGIGCPGTIARCTRPNPADRFDDISHVMHSLGREMFLKRVLWLSVGLAAVAGVILLAFKPASETTPEQPETTLEQPDTVIDRVGSDTGTVVNMDMIDELFRQATDMVTAADSQ